MSRPALLILALLTLCPALPAQRSAHDETQTPDATVVRETTIYLQADASSDKLGTIEPGRELAVLEHSDHWLRVHANIDADAARTQDQPAFGGPPPAQPISGWIQDTAVVEHSTPDGQAVVIGEAISYEEAASDAHPLPGAALSARRLYRMGAELFPEDALTPEALWRAADIRWQLQKADAATLPSAHEKENYLRQQPDETEMRRLLKFFPATKYASFAAYDLIDNKLCGDWQGSEKCPEQEAGYYQGFADHYPDSPRAPLALYESAWRLACAGDMWSQDNHEDRASADRRNAVAVARHLRDKYPDSEDSLRAAGLVYRVQHGIPVYGSDRK